MVRQRILVPPFGGSNPSTPATTLQIKEELFYFANPKKISSKYSLIINKYNLLIIMKKTLTNRIIVGKIIGLIVGILLFILAPILNINIDLYFGLGLVIFYVLLGSTIAFIGLFDKHPVFNFKMSWWFSGIFIGLTFHTMLVLLSYNYLSELLANANLFGLVSPWWALLDGIILGLIMAFSESKIAGSGDLPLQ